MTVDTTLTGPELLQAAAAAVCARPQVSASRARQVRWVAREYARALELADHPRDAEADELFAGAPVAAYLELARQGRLRVRQVAVPDRGSVAAEYVRLQVLEQLAAAAGVRPELPPLPEVPAAAPVPARPRSLLRQSLEQLADRPGATAGQVRMLAIGATVADTGARAGELCAVHLADLAPMLEDVRLWRRPQGRRPPHVEVVALSALSRAALQRWLHARHELLVPVGGTATALWVSLHPNHRGDQPVPAGTPLQPRGLARAWTRAVVEVDMQLAGEPGWEPLPTRMEQLRRGVEPRAQAAPQQPDVEQAADLLDVVAAAGCDLAAARAEDGEGSTAELAARVTARTACREAWAAGIEHQVQLGALTEAGLHGTAALAAAGWEPALLHALDRAAGHGRPKQQAAM